MLATDVGPVIDERRATRSRRYVDAMHAAGCVRHRVALPAACAHGTFVAPTLIVRRQPRAADARGVRPGICTCRDVSRRRARRARSTRSTRSVTGSRSASTAASTRRSTRIVRRARVGNVYVNRNMIGAVVGVQPFGGEGLSGHRAQGGRSALPVPLRRRAHAVPSTRPPPAATPRCSRRATWLPTRWRSICTPSSRTPGSGASFATRTLTDGAPNSSSTSLRDAFGKAFERADVDCSRPTP